MKRRRDDRADKARSRRRERGPLTAHPLFAPVLGLWGAALGGLVTLVLPRAAVLEACAGIGLAQLGEKAPYVLAAGAALGLGLALFAVAVGIARRTAKARNRKSTPSIAAMALRQVQTIDPASELGSASLDAPVEAMPFAGLAPAFVAEQGDERGEAGDPPHDAAATDDDEAAGEPAPLPPLELDLEEFGALPGRNAVWVEGPAPIAAPALAEAEAAPESGAEPEPLPEPEPEPAPVAVAVAAAARPAPAPATVSPSAIQRLRAVPTSELSLVQMVERFAAALHEHQSLPAGRAGHPADQAGRDAALAEALKALAALSEDGATTAQGEPLRAALSRLQELRGAA